MNPIYYTVFHKKSIFIPLKYIYPECSVLRTDHPQVDPLQCLESSCPVSVNCMNTLVTRVFKIFEQVEGSELLVAYYKLDNGRIRGGVFYEDNQLPPQVKTCNPFALKKFQKDGTVYQWMPTSDFYGVTRPPIITGSV